MAALGVLNLMKSDCSKTAIKKFHQFVEHDFIISKSKNINKQKFFLSGKAKLAREGE
jgi:hypothetical protein